MSVIRCQGWKQGSGASEGWPGYGVCVLTTGWTGAKEGGSYLGTFSLKKKCGGGRREEGRSPLISSGFGTKYPEVMSSTVSQLFLSYFCFSAFLTFHFPFLTFWAPDRFQWLLDPKFTPEAVLQFPHRFPLQLFHLFLVSLTGNYRK